MGKGELLVIASTNIDVNTSSVFMGDQYPKNQEEIIRLLVNALAARCTTEELGTPTKKSGEISGLVLLSHAQLGVKDHYLTEWAEVNPVWYALLRCGHLGSERIPREALERVIKYFVQAASFSGDHFRQHYVKRGEEMLQLLDDS